MNADATVTVDTGSVTVERTLERDRSAVVGTLTLRSGGDRPVLVRLAERLPDGATAGSVEVDPERAPRNWTVGDGWLVLEDVVPGDDARRLVYGYEVGRSGQRLRIPTPMVERARPLDDRTVESLEADALPTVRGGDGGTPPSRPPTDVGPDPAGRTPAEGDDASGSAATDEDVREAVRSVGDGESGATTWDDLGPSDGERTSR